MPADNIYRHPEKGAVAVKTGYCWQGFWLSIFWLAHRRLWREASLVVLAGLALSLLGHFLFGDDTLRNSIYYASWIFVISLFIGRHGNAWVEKKLLAEGYRPNGAGPADSAPAGIAGARREPPATLNR